MTADDIRLSLLELEAEWRRKRWAVLIQMQQSGIVSDLELGEAEYEAERARLAVVLFKQERAKP